MSWRVWLILPLLWLSLPQSPWAADPAQRGKSVADVFVSERLVEMDRAIEGAIADAKCPGGVLWVERGGVAYSKAYGRRALLPSVEAMTLDTIFDAASLTKVIATTPAIMKLVESGRVDLEAPVHRYIDRFTGQGRERITVRQLMTHTSGLRPGVGAHGEWKGADRAIEFACEEVPTDAPDSVFRYSDINFILLGEIVKRVSGMSLDAYCEREIFGPLKMNDTGFHPVERLRGRVAPTEKQADGTVLRGVVHDPTARRMGGVAGHAGLFTTALDLARYSRMLLAEGELDGKRVFKMETVRLMTSVKSPGGVGVKRGLGWDIDSAYSGPRGDRFPVGSFGHTGWTGTSMWLDPATRTFVLFLSNRNHPGEDGTVLGLRRVLGTLAAESLKGVDWKQAKGQGGGGVLNGIDVLVRDGFKPLKGKKVGLITNHTGIDRERRATIDLLRGAEGVTLVALFSPEHGIRGVVDAKVPDGLDERTGLPIYSLYGDTRAPRPEQMVGLDLLVYDLQDVGCRFYTYISTLGESMTAAGKAGVPFMVLDRVNPITGVKVEGPILDGARSFVGWHEIPLRHGMTAGELAKMFNAERALGVNLTVIPCEGWKRGQWFDATGLPWINTSPNMRSLTQATLYSGVGMIEMCNISVGRGTDAPFERVGAPYVEDRRLAQELNAAGLAGVRFIPIRFTPAVNKFGGMECGGVQILLTDRELCRAVDVGVVLATVLHRLYPVDFGVERVEKLLIDPRSLGKIRKGESLEEIRISWAGEQSAFLKRREGFLIYK
jgi:uncharacterized protein YbbC (DUF1343 family)